MTKDTEVHEITDLPKERRFNKDKAKKFALYGTTAVLAILLVVTEYKRHASDEVEETENTDADV